MRPGLAPSSLVTVLLAVGSGPGCEDSTCTPGTADDGSVTLAVGPFCLRGVTAQARRDGTSIAADARLEASETTHGLRLLVSAPAGADALALRVPGVRADRLLQQGYQSWSFAGAVSIPDEVTLASDGLPAFAASSGDVTAEEDGVSYGATALGDADGPYLVLGALSARRATTGIAAIRSPDGEGRADVTIVYGAAREPLPTDDSGRVVAEPLLVLAAERPLEGLARLADAMRAELPADAGPRRPPGGWFSWNERFADIDPAYLRAHIEPVRSALAPAGLPLLEIDDGWMPAWGDWTEREAFAGELEPLVGEIAAAGLVPGIWMAPFLVDLDSATAAAIDPALLVAGPDGAPLVLDLAGLPGRYHVLDGGSAEAMAIATAPAARLAAAGVRFFKLDFLYAGATPGARASGRTGVEALREGLALLRAAVGPDAVLNGCGAPIAPVLGLVDSLRIGPDTAFEIVDLDWPLVTYAARNLAARAWLAPLVWVDADQAQLRVPFTLDEARASAVVAALAGPAYALGDDLTRLPPERLALALADDVLDLARAPTPAEPVDLLERPASRIPVSPIVEVVRTPGRTEAPPPREYRAVGASGARYRVVFEWGVRFGDPHAVTVTRE